MVFVFLNLLVIGVMYLSGCIVVFGVVACLVWWLFMFICWKFVAFGLWVMNAWWFGLLFLWFGCCTYVCDCCVVGLLIVVVRCLIVL